MSPVSLSPHLSARGHATPIDVVVVPAPDESLTKKRASIHYPDDSTAAKRMSLHFGPRCRSLSESWALSPPLSASAVVPTSSRLSPASAATATTTATDTTGPMQDREQQPKEIGAGESNNSKECTSDQELMKTLASFLQGEDKKMKDGELSHQDKGRKQKQTTTKIMDDCRTIRDAQSSWSDEMSLSAGPDDLDDALDLVVTVRDFAYAKTHPYHLGQYPPEPEYEESEYEEDDEDEQEMDSTTDRSGAGEEGSEERTHGQAHGLYDFDAESEGELSFREGDNLWIHCRQYPGWLLGEMNGQVGLVPENYVQIL
ncbi:hypothetical protein BGW38_003162 [Lunasporangiospora selenospora]|uniref:SH3 domain-containing protein n=1 Tax=Lunasporangiospora selenospora TaxID=979761 RepID=A0A9P6FRW1_9FUNG|nr:hypothetical protein BGW38_003162 [Lunasporangiospora selenospora]